MMRALGLGVLLIGMGGVSSLICPAFSQEEVALNEFVARVVPQLTGKIEFKIIPEEKGFSFDRKGDVLVVKARDVNLGTAGLGYYVRFIEGGHFSWNGDRLPQKLRFLSECNGVTVPNQWDWKFMYNYCTLSYTSAFWGEKEWEREIDYLALNGASHALVMAGMGKVWQLTLRELGFPEEEIIKFIPNPSADAWWGMGNLQGHSGPMSQNMIDKEAKLGRFIVQRMKSLGIEPTLPGFVGLVPSEFPRLVKLEGAEYYPQGSWVINKFVRPTFLDPTTPAFDKIADIYYKNLKQVYGVNDIAAFSGDLFHEGGSAHGVKIPEAAHVVQKKMLEASPQATWVIQAWSGNPTAQFLEKLDTDKVVVAALEGNLDGVINGGANYNPHQGMPWIFGDLQNFGGRQSLYGPMNKHFKLGDMVDSPGRKMMKGLGIFSEGTEHNPMYYELFFQRFWLPSSKSFSDQEQLDWLSQYAKNRYGSAPKPVIDALSKLNKSVYSPTRSTGGSTENILCGRPARYMERVSTWAPGGICYNALDTIDAANDYLQAAEQYPELLKEPNFQFDLMDICRHISGEIARPLLEAIMRAYDANNIELFDQLSADYLDLILQTDAVAGTIKQARFGEMYERALAKGDTPEEKKIMSLAAKRLVTTWSGDIDSLNDYAHRQLSGLMKDYYLPRWKMFFDTHRKALKGDISREAVSAEFRKVLHPHELSWEKEDTVYTSHPEGDTFALAKKMISKFTGIINEHRNLIKEEIGELWTISDGKSELVFNISDIIVQEGDYSVTFNYQSGNNALIIESVALYEGDKLISEDKHLGKTGVDAVENVYRIKVSQLRTNLDAYILKAKVGGFGGRDSSGKMVIRKVKNN